MRKAIVLFLMNFSLASSSLVTGNHRYTGKSTNANKAAELLSLCSFFCCV